MSLPIRPSFSSSYEAVEGVVIAFFLGRFLNQFLDKYNVLTYSQFYNGYHVITIMFYATALRMDWIFTLFFLNIGMYRLASYFTNSMQNNFMIILYFTRKIDPQFESIKNLMSKDSQPRWVKISQLDKLAKNPIAGFALFHQFSKKDKSENS